MSKVVISIVSWNHAKYLTDALNSVRAQTHPDVSVVVVDNASSDSTSELVQKNFPEVALLRNTRNLGFSRAHNQAIEYSRANHAKDGDDLFILVMNPDIILHEDFLARLLDRMAHRADVGSAGGKLLRVFEVMDGDMTGKEFSRTVDSTGIKIFKSRRAVDRDSGEEDSGGFQRTGEVFGVSGACALYRLRALIDAAPDSKYFDEDYFAYKEDVDLAWRLQLLGWKSLYVPDAVAFHYRYLATKEKSTWLSVLRGRKGRSRFLSQLSYRNHLMTLVKNEHLGNFLIHFPRIWFQETKKGVYLMLFEPAVFFGALPAIIGAIPKAIRKRRVNLGRARVAARDIRRWFA
jgi:GT2 family glycosyltransferase